MASLKALAFLATALVLQPASAVSSHFLAPEPLARTSQNEGEKTSAAQVGSSRHEVPVIPVLLQELVGGLQSVESAWESKVRRPESPSRAYDPEDLGRQDASLSWKAVFVDSFLSWLFWLIAALLSYITCYRGISPVPEKKVDGDSSNESDVLQKLQDRFSSGHFHCLEDSGICMCSFFCPALRWSDTASLAGVLIFWAAFAAFSAATLVNMFVNGAMFGVILAFLMLYFRQQLRGQLDVPSWTVGSCCIDFFYVCLCPCCAIAQEAGIVKEGIENGYAFSSP